MKIFAHWSWIITPLMLMAAKIGKGHAKSIVVWVCLWSIDVALAISTWRLYQAWRDYSALTADSPYYHDNQPKMPEGLIWSALIFIVILVLPVVWFYRDWRKEGVAAGTA